MPMSKQLTAAIKAGIRCRVERYPGRGRNRYWITRDDMEILAGPYYPQAVGIEAQLAIHAGKTPPPQMEGGPTRPTGPLENIVRRGDVVWMPLG